MHHVLGRLRKERRDLGFTHCEINGLTLSNSSQVAGGGEEGGREGGKEDDSPQPAAKKKERFAARQLTFPPSLLPPSLQAYSLLWAALTDHREAGLPPARALTKLSDFFTASRTAASSSVGVGEGGGKEEGRRE